MTEERTAEEVGVNLLLLVDTLVPSPDFDEATLNEMLYILNETGLWPEYAEIGAENAVMCWRLLEFSRLGTPLPEDCTI